MDRVTPVEPSRRLLDMAERLLLGKSLTDRFWPIAGDHHRSASALRPKGTFQSGGSELDIHFSAQGRSRAAHQHR